MRRTAVILGVMGWLALGLFTGMVVAQSSEPPQLRVAESTFDTGTVQLGTIGQYRGFCRKVRFWGKIQKSGVRNSMAYRCQHSRKSNFATEPDHFLIILSPFSLFCPFPFFI